MKKMKLGSRMFAGFGLLILISAALGGVAVWDMNHVSNEAFMLTKEFVPEVKISNEIERCSHEAMVEFRSYGLTDEKQYLDAGKKYFEEIKRHLKEAGELASKSPHLLKLKESVARIEANLGEYEKLVSDTTAKNGDVAKDHAKLDELATQYMKDSGDYLDSQNEQMHYETRSGGDPSKLEERFEKISSVTGLISLGNGVRLATWRSQARRDPKGLQEAGKEFGLIEKELAKLKAATKKEDNLKQIESIRAASVAYKAALDELKVDWLTQDELGKKRLATGDAIVELTKNLANSGMEQTDQVGSNAVSSLSSGSRLLIIGFVASALIGLAFAFFITSGITRSIRRVIEGLAGSAQQVASASIQVSSGSQQLAEGTSQQAASIEETSSSLEEMSSMTRQNAQNADQANSSMQEMSNVVREAKVSMDALTSSMAEMSKASEETQRIVKTIDEIAFQTNLLALNAAVEAARAGEAGAGFAVVAEEVRNLAMRAAQASGNTAGLIEDTVKKIKEGSLIVSKAGEDFDRVAGGAKKVGELVSEITAASDEQAKGIDQLNRAVAEMEKVTQQNASNAEESAAASQQMSSQAEQMKTFLEELIELVGSARGTDSESSGRASAKIGAPAGMDGRKRFRSTENVPARPAKEGAVRKERALQTAAPGIKEVSPEEVIPFEDGEFDEF